MKDVLKQICALQPSYSSANTLPMQERGRLIRDELAEELRRRLPLIESSFDTETRDLDVEASDGIGRKTEAPWVRVFSKRMSPTARDGFYIVFHFRRDGSALFITIGCGSTVWSGGDLKPVSDDVLAGRTEWARNIVRQSFGNISPFNDEIALGAKAPLPRTFEKATALAVLLPVGKLEETDIDELLVAAAKRLNAIYRAQLGERDISAGEQDVAAIITLAKPLSRSRRQGFGLSATERRAIERQAMKLAHERLSAEGYTCRDVSATESFDILAAKAGIEVKVEVKGTTSDMCDSILMTRNEIDLHRKEKGSTALIIVSQITLDRTSPQPIAEGGVVEAHWSWDIDSWSAEPIAFQLSRKTSASRK